MTSLDVGAESEKSSVRSEDDGRTAFWVDYAKTHSPEEIGRMIAQKEKEAVTDSLTGIYNMRGWERQVEVFSNLAERRQEALSFGVIDIDDFKTINDTWGHEVGNQALVFVKQVVKNCLRESDILARIGGDEFAFLLPETDGYGAKVIRDYVIEELKRSFSEMDDNDTLKAANLLVSIGISTKVPGEDPHDAIMRADQDMYKVKGIKKNV